jgi:HEPN domain-containing protein
LPSPEQIEYADVLLRKAEGDLAAVRTLIVREEIPDDIVGFHAQQAAEKAAKAVLTLRGVDYPRTHDVHYLADQLRELEGGRPREIADAAWLTAWATEFRYADPPPPALNREEALASAEAAVVWARSSRDEFSPT